jgi:hypothetical protein
MRLIVLLCAFGAALGCNSSNSATPSNPMTCASAVAGLCQAACTCAATDSSQACSLGSLVDGAIGTRESWASASDCELFFGFACADGGPPAGFDYAACATAVTSAKCVTTVAGPALAFPAACNVSLPDGGADAAM